MDNYIQKYMHFLVFLVILSSAATAQIEFNDSSDIQFRTGLNMNSNSIVGLPDATVSSEPITLGQIGDDVVNRSGDTLEGNLDMNGYNILNLGKLEGEGDIEMIKSGDPVLEYSAGEATDYRAFFRYSSNYSGDTSDNRAVIGTQSGGSENIALTAERQGSWVRSHSNFEVIDGNNITLKDSPDPRLDYEAYESSGTGVFWRYDSSFENDDSDNRMSVGTENGGTEHLVYTADRDGDRFRSHRNFEVVDGNNITIDGPNTGDPVVSFRAQEADSRGAHFRYSSSYGGDDSDNRLVVGTESGGTEYDVYMADRDGDWIDLKRPLRETVQLRDPSVSDPILDYRFQESNDYGAFLRYSSQFGGDTSDNRLVLGTEQGGTDYPGITIERSTQDVKIPNGDLNVPKSIIMSNGVTIGDSNSGTSGVNSIAIGDGAKSDREDSVAIGTEAEALDTSQSWEGSSVSIGHLATTSSGEAIAIGDNASATVSDSTAVGNDAEASGDEAVAYGEASARSEGAVAVGEDADSSSRAAMALGRNAEASGLGAIAVTTNSESSSTNLINANADYAIAVGEGTEASAQDAVAIGRDAEANQGGDVAVGYEAANGASAAGKNSVFGYRAGKNNAGDDLVAIGYNAGWYNEGSFATAVGTRALEDNTGNNAVGIGYNAGAANQYDNTISIGKDSNTSATGAVAIGYDANSGQDYTARFGSNSQAYDVEVTGDATIKGDYAEIRGDSSGDPVIDYRLQEGNDYGAFMKYNSQFGGDTGDNRLVIGTEDSGSDITALSVERSGGQAYIHRNTNLTGNDINNVGTLNANTKNFVQDVNGTHEIVYTSSESGEVVVEWSDSVDVDTKGTEVTLPDHLQEVMSSEEDYHVITTSVNSLANTGVFNKTDSGFTLKASKDTEVDFHVRGVRKGFEDKEILREK